MADKNKTIHSTGNYTLDRVEIAALPNDEGKSPAFDVTNSVLSFYIYFSFFLQ